MLSSPLCSGGTSEPGHPGQAFGAEFVVNGLLPLMALVQAVPLPVLFVIISYPSNYNWRVVKDCCRWHMGEFGDKRVRAGKGGFNPPFNSTMAVMGVQLQGLLALELAALLPPCKLEGKISLYPPPPPPAPKSERTPEMPAGHLGRMGSGFSPADQGCFAMTQCLYLLWRLNIRVSLPLASLGLFQCDLFNFGSFLRLFSPASQHNAPQNQPSHDNGEDSLQQQHSSLPAVGSQGFSPHRLPTLAQAACSRRGPGEVGSGCRSNTV